MYHTEEKIPDKPYYNKPNYHISCCITVIIIGFILLVGSLAGYFSTVFLGGD